MRANILINETLKGNIEKRVIDGYWDVKISLGLRYCNGGFSGDDLHIVCKTLDHVVKELADYYKTSDIQVLFHTI